MGCRVSGSEAIAMVNAEECFHCVEKAVGQEAEEKSKENQETFFSKDKS